MKMYSKIAVIFLLVALATKTKGFELETTTNQVQSFVGNKKAKLVYSISDGTVEGLYYIDLSESPLTPKRICQDLPDNRSLIVSPDGDYILYTVSEEIYIRTIMENSPDNDRRRIRKGQFPKWWIHPKTKEVYILFSIQTNDKGIYCQKLDTQMKVSGSPTKLFDDYRAGGGRSADGRFLAAHGFAFMWELEPASTISNASAKTSVVFRHSNVGNCYGFMCPSGNRNDHHYGCVMHFNGGHTDIVICRFAPEGKTTRYFETLGDAVADSSVPLHTIPIPDNSEFTGFGWKTCTWSSHENFGVAIGLFIQKSTSNYYRNLYAVNIHEETVLNIITTEQRGSFNNPFLWIETNDEERVKAVFTADPVRGTAPISVSFQADASTGANILYRWEFGDGTTGSGSSLQHTYNTPGTYIAKLIVSNSHNVDTASIEIIADKKAPTVSELKIIPTSPIRIMYSSEQTFTVEAYDNDNKIVPDIHPKWNVTGNGGGKIQQNGTYTAGENTGGVDTIMAVHNSIEALCVVHIIGDPISLTSTFDQKGFNVTDTLSITWNADTLRVNNVHIFFSHNGGKTWYPLTENRSIMTNDDSWGAFRWPIPQFIDGISVISNECKIKIQDYYEHYNPVESQGTFSIHSGAHSVPSLKLFSDGHSHNVMLYPNKITVAFLKETHCTIMVFNMQGECLFRNNFAHRSAYNLELPFISRGIYILRVITSDNIDQMKFIAGF